VSWHERDWAKWTDAERQRFYGSKHSTSRSPTWSSPQSSRARTWSSPQNSRKRRTRGETLAALTLIAAAVAYQSGVFNHSVQRTTGAPLSGSARTRYLGLPQTPATATTPPSPRYTTMSGPSSVSQGTYMTVTGTLPPGVSGPIIVEGRWESGPWYELASTNASDGGFRVRYALRRPGLVHVRLALPNGNYVVRTIDVT
jgi:hypothetical protein